MGLSLEFEDGTGTVHTAAYAKVDMIQLWPEEGRVYMAVGIYHDQGARLDGKTRVHSDRMTVEDIPAHEEDGIPVVADDQFTDYFDDVVLKGADASPQAQAYAYLKARVKRYVNTVDVLE